MNSESQLQSESVEGVEAEEKLAASAAARAVRQVQAGMTLIEIMIVLAIIALVMGLLVGPAIIGKLDQAKKDTARAMTKQIEAARSRWLVSSEKECPDGLDDLKQELGRRKGDTIKDPWGHEYVLKCGDQAPEECDGFCVLSIGKDGKEGTEDDIKSWQAAKK
jgi:general secretion pathway protein G